MYRNLLICTSCFAPRFWINSVRRYPYLIWRKGIDTVFSDRIISYRSFNFSNHANPKGELKTDWLNSKKE